MKKKSSTHSTKKKFRWQTLLIMIGYFILAFVFYGSRLLAPLHIPIAIIALIFGLKKARFLYLTHVQKDATKLEKKALTFVKNHRIALSVTAILLALWYTYVSLVPNDEVVFSNLAHGEIAVIIDEDMIAGAQLIDMLTITGEKLLNNVALYKNELSADEQESLRRDWNYFLTAAIASEYLTDKHRFFHQIPVFTEQDLHQSSFTITYALYMKKFEYFHKIITEVGGNDQVRTILNEYSPVFKSDGSYNDVASRFFATNSFLRRNVGYLYYRLLGVSSEPSPEEKVLIAVANDSYHYLFKNAFSHITDRSVTYFDSFNDTVSDSWLPIQKTVFVDTIGNLHVSSREEKFITLDDIETMKHELLPGDIFVARKNWYASNVGIPGFWTHAGLYTGTLENMQLFFADVFPFTSQTGNEYMTLEGLLMTEYPNAYAAYNSLDHYGHTPSVIESETKGTMIQSIEHSASVDYFSVMRTNLSKEVILRSLLRAFEHYGKPYDYEFDLSTKDDIFCSELVYDAYVPLQEKAGITFPTSVVAGREIVSPLDVVKKFVTEKGTPEQELSFVYFLDGNEETLTASIAPEETFIESYARPKFSVLQQ
jgi:hypothetical protein